MKENTNFINENSINLNIDELIELNNLDIIYDILSFKYPYIKNNISLGLEYLSSMLLISGSLPKKI